MEQKLIRNFCIISHIDHGKSTLADRFLELTETIPKSKMEEQYLDRMSLEREHGITIKMHPCRMVYPFEEEEYILNLIDTPGHVDFSYEVSRALAAVEGAILLVDASKGIQAQTIANLELAKKEGLSIIPAINKIDLAHSQVEKNKRELANLLKIKEEDILKISAKDGTNVEELLKVVIEKVPPPKIPENQGTRALIFDSKYDSFQGVVAFVRVVEGEIKKRDEFILLQKKKEGEVKEIGYFVPDLSPKENLSTGMIGYVKTGMKNPEDVRIGDTIFIKEKKQKAEEKKVLPLAGYKEPETMIFSSIFPKEPTTFAEIKEAIEELHLSDPSFSFEEERKKMIGIGFRCGFLGILHFEIILERLKKDYKLNIVVVRPTVPFRIVLKNGEEENISSAEDFPEPSFIEKIEEPWVKLEIITPKDYFNDILQLFRPFKINFISSENFGEEKLKINCGMPFRKLIENFYDKLKSISQGFASMSFDFLCWKEAELLKMDILVLKEKEPSLSKIVEKSELEKEARETVEKIKKIFPSQLFSVPIQAAVGGKIIARETVKAKRKDVTASLYGGDVTRKKKLLKKQKKGKEKLALKAKISVPSEVVIKLLKE
ncbi:MAG: translation elongation factor 4 [Candidatus Pacebacteria bacterium]|nr:translation elongation factor 4 [Candidatus Paceibacterota bacterium]